MLAHGHGLTDDDLVFCDVSGEPLWGRHVTTLQLKALLRRAGLPAIRFHDLRHTFATLQLTAGTNPKIVSEVLGHKEVAITLDRYSHALPTLGVEAMGRLDAVLGRSPLDAPDEGPTEAASAELWVDEEPAAWSLTGSDGDKGPDKGPNAARRATKRPHLSSDRADDGEVGTAYRIRTGDLRLERAVS